MKSLIRTRSGAFSLENSLKLSEIEAYMQQGKLLDHIIRVEDMFPVYKKVKVSQEFTKYIYNGNRFAANQTAVTEQDSEYYIDTGMTRLVRVYDWQDQFIGIYEYISQDKLYIPVKMFL